MTFSKSKRNFISLLILDKTNKEDFERISFFYIIGSVLELYNNKDNIYNFEEHCINLDFLENTSICSSSKKLLCLGFNLYNNFSNNYTTLDILSCLDTERLEIALDAIKIRFNNITNVI